MPASHPCQRVDLGFVDTAPFRFVSNIDLNISPEQLFEVLADETSWPRWASVITNVTWTSPEPRGVGTTRTVDMRGGITGEEEFLAWEPFTHMAFRFNESTTSSITAFASDSAPGACYASHDNGTTVFNSADAQAVRTALAAASPGSTVKVAGYCSGTQTQGGTTQTALITQTITLAGGYTTTDWTTYNPAANPTALDALGGGRVIVASVAATLRGFTMTGGYISSTVNANGGGINATGALTLSEMIVSGNTITGAAGTQNGGGAYIGGAANVSNTTFSINEAKTSGGGLYANTTLALTDTQFLGNTATTNAGGGAYASGAATLTGGVFQSNASSNQGGGLFANGTLALTGGVFQNNASSNQGGGLFANGTLALTGTQFVGNTATNGGGLYLNTANAKQAVNLLFARNRATSNGAAIYVADAAPFGLVHATIASPTLPSGAQAAIFVAAGTVYITNSIIASHTTGIQRNGGTVTQNNNLFFANTNHTVGTVNGGPSPKGNPAFFDSVSYTLTASSAAIDVGINAGIPTDFFGNARPQGGASDAGYAESPFTAPASGYASCFAEYTGDNVTDFSSADASAVRSALAAAATPSAPATTSPRRTTATARTRWAC